jgi:hypothetical protein
MRYLLRKEYPLDPRLCRPLAASQAAAANRLTPVLILVIVFICIKPVGLGIVVQ